MLQNTGFCSVQSGHPSKCMGVHLSSQLFPVFCMYTVLAGGNFRGCKLVGPLYSVKIVYAQSLEWCLNMRTLGLRRHVFYPMNCWGPAVRMEPGALCNVIGSEIVRLPVRRF